MIPMGTSYAFDGWGPWPRYVLVPVKRHIGGLVPSWMRESSHIVATDVRILDRWGSQLSALASIYTLEEGRRRKRELNAQQFVIAAIRWEVAAALERR